MKCVGNLLGFRSRGVQMECKHRLAELQLLPQSLDVLCVLLPHRRRANRVELAHRDFADCVHFVERCQVATQ